MSTAILSAAAAGALGGPRLEDVQRSVLDRELDVLDVAVVALQHVHRRLELGVRAGQHLLELARAAAGADAGDDVLALGVDEELAVRRLARRWPGRA